MKFCCLSNGSDQSLTVQLGTTCIQIYQLYVNHPLVFNLSVIRLSEVLLIMESYHLLNPIKV